MKIERIGEVIEQPDGGLLITKWVIDGEGADWNDIQDEIIKIAKENGTYKPYLEAELNAYELTALDFIKHRYNRGEFGH